MVPNVCVAIAEKIKVKRARVSHLGPCVDWQAHRLHQVGLSQELADLAQQLGMALTKDRAEATAFVVESVALPGQRTEICSIINATGALNMTTEFLESSGSEGAMVQYWGDNQAASTRGKQSHTSNQAGSHPGNRTNTQLGGQHDAGHGMP